MSRFRRSGTTTVPLGPCDCPGRPHADGDSAEVLEVLGWADLVDVRGGRSPGQQALILVTRAVASWTFLEQDGDGVTRPVPVTEANVDRLDEPTSDLLWPAAKLAYDAAEAPLPNASGEASQASPPESESSTPTTRTRERPTSSR